MTGVALVSGGSRGIGAAIVTQLVRDGFDVAFCYRSEEKAARELVDASTAMGVRVIAEQVDVSDAEATRSWVTRMEHKLGGIDLTVASAGITRDTPLALMGDGDWTDVLHTNLDGVHNVCKPAVFSMMKRRAGCVITIASISGIYGHATQTNYSASKAGIIGFTRALAKETGKYGIRANVVAPGLVDTDMTSVLGDQMRKDLLKSIPLKRFGRADEVADLVSFLASERATYITGSVMEIHGGITI